MSNQKYILTVTLNPAIDKTIFIDSPELKGSMYKGREIISAGGKGINVSRALQKLKTSTLATGIIGGCTGIMIKHHLDKENIQHKFFDAGKEIRTNLTIFDQKNQKIRILEEGPLIPKIRLKAFGIIYEKLLNKASLVVLSGRNTPSAPQGYYARLARVAKRRKVPVVLDTSGSPLRLGIRQKLFMVKPNVKEAEEVFNVKLKSINAIKRVIHKIHGFQTTNVLISMGDQGLIGSNHFEVWWAKCPKVKAVNEVGCGDAAIAGFLHSYFKGSPFAEHVKTAAAVATASANTNIPGLFQRDDLNNILKRVKLKKI